MNFQNKNLRNESKQALKAANKAWADCVAQDYLPKWLSGENLNVTEVCSEQLEKLRELDAENYPTGLPFKFSPAAQWKNTRSREERVNHLYDEIAFSFIRDKADLHAIRVKIGPVNAKS